MIISELNNLLFPDIAKFIKQAPELAVKHSATVGIEHGDDVKIQFAIFDGHLNGKSSRLRNRLISSDGVTKYLRFCVAFYGEKVIEHFHGQWVILQHEDSYIYPAVTFEHFDNIRTTRYIVEPLVIVYNTWKNGVESGCTQCSYFKMLREDFESDGIEIASNCDFPK